MRYVPSIVWTCLLAGIVAALQATPASAQSGAKLFVGDYNQKSIYEYDTNGKLVGGGPFIGSTYNVKEGIEGTADTVLAVTGGGASISRFTSSGTYIGLLQGKNLAGTATQTYSSIGNVQITPDAQYLFVPDSGAGELYKVSVATGNVVAQVAMTGVHDVAIDAAGDVFAAAYNSTATGGSGVIEYKNTTGGAYSNLSSATTFVTPGYTASDGYILNRPSGISIDSHGNVYVVNENETLGSGSGSASQSNGAVFEFSSSGSFIHDTTSSSLQGAFGTAFAPDGNLYIATLGNFLSTGSTGPGSDPGYTDGVYEFNTTTNAISLFVAGGSTVSGQLTPNSTTDLEGPKYVQFASDFASASDPGYSAPEPASGLLFGSYAGLLGTFLTRFRKRCSRSGA